MQELKPEKFLRLREVIELTGLGKTTIYARINEGKFPRSIQISDGLVAWRAADVARWQAGRVAEANKAA